MNELRSAWWRAVGLLHVSDFATAFLDKLRADFESVVPKITPGIRKRPFVPGAHAAVPAFREVLAAQGAVSLVENLIGRTSRVVGGDATRYFGETRWHVDVQEWTLPIVKLVIYLDPQNEFDEFLYLPCSHCYPDRFRNPEALHKLASSNGAGTPVHRARFKAGDAIFFNPRLAHAVLSHSSRRQLATLYAADPTTPVESSEFRNLVLMNALVA